MPIRRREFDSRCPLHLVARVRRDGRPGRWLKPIAARSGAVAYSRSLGSEHEWQCACPASRMVRVRAPQGPPDRRLVAQWNESAALRKQRSRVRISSGRPVRGSSWRSGRSCSPSKREDVGSNPTDETRLLRRRSMAGRSDLTRVMVVRVHPSQPSSWPRSSMEEQLGPNETVAGSSPAGAPNVFVAFWLSTTGRAPGC